MLAKLADALKISLADPKDLTELRAGFEYALVPCAFRGKGKAALRQL